MLVIPAIDIMGGKAVRLYQGDYNKKTVYGDPVEIAQKFKDMGAKYLHIVDLDGAGASSPAPGESRLFNPGYDVIAEICAKVKIPVQVGGGIRSKEAAEKYLRIADRVILGTIAVKNPGFAGECIREYGAGRIAVSVDVLDDEIAVCGWTENSGMNYLDFIERLKSVGVQTIIATDISKDGALSSPNWKMYEKIKGVNIIVSGGVSCEADVEKARGYYGVIVGKAYYEGKVDLEKCLNSKIAREE